MDVVFATLCRLEKKCCDSVGPKTDRDRDTEKHRHRNTDNERHIDIE